MRLPQKTTFDTLQKTSECHEVPRLPRETKKCHIVKPPKVTPSAELTKGTAIWPSRGRLRTVADGCERLGNVERTHPQPPDPQSETGTFAMHSGKKNLQNPESRHISSYLVTSRRISSHLVLCISSSIFNETLVTCRRLSATKPAEHKFDQGHQAYRGFLPTVWPSEEPPGRVVS